MIGMVRRGLALPDWPVTTPWPCPARVRVRCGPRHCEDQVTGQAPVALEGIRRCRTRSGLWTPFCDVALRAVIALPVIIGSARTTLAVAETQLPGCQKTRVLARDPGRFESVLVVSWVRRQ